MPRLDRALMPFLAPRVFAQDADDAAFEEVSELLEQIWTAFDEARAEVLPTEEPAVRFDPFALGGHLPPPPLLTAKHPPLANQPSRALSGDVVWLPLSDIATQVEGGGISAQDVVNAFAARVEHLQPRVNAFITPTFAQADRAATASPSGRLAGVPVGLKDLIATAGVPTTGGSKILADAVPTEDAACWARLRAAGAILLGKLNTHEFAAGVTSENEHYGDVRNPWNLDRMAGGSSGGSAAAVAAAMVAGALGTDTGGSIRIPAACCGVVGLKPTYGIVSMRGVYPLSWSLDHVGPIGRTVRDVALLFDVMTGASCEQAARDGADGGCAGVTIGIPRRWLAAEMQPAVAETFERAVSELERLGAKIVTVETPDLRLMMAVNRAIAYAEGSAWHEPFLSAHREYGMNVLPRMQAGLLITAAEYLQAQRLRTRVCRTFADGWARADVLVTPALPVTAPTLGSRYVELAGRREPIGAAMVRFVAPFNLTGSPALVFPCGFDDEGLPIGLQLAAPPGREDVLCFVGAAYEAATPYHRMRPALAETSTVSNRREGAHRWT